MYKKEKKKKKEKERRKKKKRREKKVHTELMINCVIARRSTSLLCIKIALELGEKQV